MVVRKAQGVAWICNECSKIVIQPPCNCPDCSTQIHDQLEWCGFCGEGGMKEVVKEGVS